MNTIFYFVSFYFIFYFLIYFIFILFSVLFVTCYLTRDVFTLPSNKAIMNTLFFVFVVKTCHESLFEAKQTRTTCFIVKIYGKMFKQQSSLAKQSPNRTAAVGHRDKNGGFVN